MFKEDVTQFCPECEKWARKCEKLKQKLEEIKEIAQFACDKSICHKNCSICSDGKILQIINEVKSEDLK